MKKLLIKVIAKAIIITIVLTIISTFANSALIDNYLAMGQMDHDNVSFVVWEMYNNLRHIISVIGSLIVAFVIFTLGKDIYNFIKIKEIKNEEV